MISDKYKRTDLARECKSDDITSGSQIHGISYTEENVSGFELSLLDILSKEGEKTIGKPKGRYITIDVGKVWTLSDEKFNTCTELLSDQIKDMLKHVAGKDEIKNVLVAGLGNRYITSDAIGHETVKNIIVTRHIKDCDTKLYEMLGGKSVSAVTPGVIGQTGIETLELIRGAVTNVKPEAVIVIDALAAGSLSHLATTVQITDTGLSPGSGIGNKRLAINRDSLGCPVIAVGVPTVVESSTLVYAALEEAGIQNISPELTKVLENGRGFFVTPKESDIVTSEISRLLSEAVNLALS